ncbi:SDR family NAD(P)-dependent oxidoreductase [Alteribacillus iranensis]|uniref:3-hydroxybutyrate dehydrogenase/3-oxoacyl-[acyl-carrier protein] reductase n=1 Tax=Alteribacillus iranensis TaxID=930128 RepID=A0A1I2BBH9_9BACI|nr:SDR family oxidoreductase [Alteribacillus iranensis]SFE53524.1 3-hydroxybutyrate dehydrogenase/3-oxoacyl-[acyl-carrier protein] reductase [Alteribacillus iranensis]
MIFSDTALSGKHVIITGATGDIGGEIAKVVTAMGAKVSLTGRNEDKLNKLKAEPERSAREENIFIQPAELNDAADRERMVDAMERKNGSIHGLVNCAGVVKRSMVTDMTEEMLHHVMTVNFTSTVLLTQLVYKKMIPNESGSIVNIASLSGLRGTIGNAMYASSKFALIGFTQSLALEAIQHNINVNAICPGFVEGQMARDVIEYKARENNISYEEQKKITSNTIPSGALTQPEEIANITGFLLTGIATNVVGESIKISGGSVV